MQRLLSLCLASLLAAAPALGLAEGLPGSGLIPPIPPPTAGFVSLFRSPAPPPPRIEAAPPGQPPLAIMPARDVAQRVGPLVSPGAMCRAALSAAEAKYGIPAGLLQAIGVVESGRRDEATGRREPWPWTINAEGEPHVFDNKDQAVACCVKKARKCHAVREMKVDPSGPPCRGRLQTTISCFGRKAAVVNVMEKAWQ
jgi:hypothetical protein